MGLKQWNESSYKSSGTTLEMVGGERIKSNLLIVSFGGEGNDQDYFGALSAFNASGKRIPAADMRYDDIHGLDFDAMGRVMKEAQRKRGFTHAVLDCHSLGGMIGLFTALRAGIPVAGIVLNSTPENLGNATTGAKLAADLVTAPMAPKDMLTQDVELGFKDIWCYFRDADSVGSSIVGLPRELWSLPSQMTQGGSARLQETQLEDANELNYDEIMPTLIRNGIIRKGVTSPVFVMSTHDGVIHPMDSYHAWSNEFARAGITHMPLVQMGSGSGHADVFGEGAPLQKIGYYDSLIRLYDTEPPALV
ncbi:MAG TPA: alpha/beta hydrolase [Candidatus Saccharimonadales bacterium]